MFPIAGSMLNHRLVKLYAKRPKSKVKGKAQIQ